MKKSMIANRRFTYGTRRLQADDKFEATTNDAKILAALGHARIVGEPAPLVTKRAKQASQPVQEPIPEPDDEDQDDNDPDDEDNDDEDQDDESKSEAEEDPVEKDPKTLLVNEARALGIDADESWGMKRLRKEIKAAKA